MRNVFRPVAALLAAAGLFSSLGCHHREPKPDPTKDEWEHIHEHDDTPARPPAQAPAAEPWLVSPPEGTVFSPVDLKHEQSIVTFTWSSSGPGLAYVLEIARDRNFTDVLLRQPVPRNVLAYRMSQPGKYYWRVIAPGEVRSPTRTFTIERGVSVPKEVR